MVIARREFDTIVVFAVWQAATAAVANLPAGNLCFLWHCSCTADCKL
jgi:hypothetical protein